MLNAWHPVTAILEVALFSSFFYSSFTNKYVIFG